MVECKCIRNLMGFASSKPPCVAFTVCLAAFAVGLLSLGYYVHEHGLSSFDANENKEWKTLITDLKEKKFCVFGNETEITNSTSFRNETTSADELVPVSISVFLSLLAKEGFESREQHVTQLTTLIDASEAGIAGINFITVTLSLSEPWHTKCEEKETCHKHFDTCAVMLLPKAVVPQDFLDKPDCNVTAVHTMVQMYSRVNDKPVTPGGWCYHGVEALAIPAITLNRAAMQIDEDTVNLRLQYSSYFLFVMVITSVLYGMIKGKPFKNGKKMSQPI